MKKACIALIPLLFALCIFCAPHAALASEEVAACSVSVSQSDILVAPGATVTVGIHVSVTAGSTAQLSIQLGELSGLTITNATVSSGWYFAVESSSYLNVRGDPVSAGGSIDITLTMDFAPDADGTYVYDVYGVSYFDPVYDEPMSAGGGTATFEVHTRGADWVTDRAPTCTQVGRSVIKCVNCDYVYEINPTPIPMVAHVPGAPTITTPPACLTDGVETTFCVNCGTVLATQPIPATGHTPGSWHTVDRATCTERGRQEKHCTVCDALLDSRTFPAKGHTPWEWVVTTRQTTENPGVESLLCAVCGIALETRELPVMSEPKQDSPAALPGESLQEAAPKLAEKWPTYTAVNLSKHQIYEFPIVAQGGYVVGTATVTVDENGTVTITYTLTAKGASIRAGSLAFLPADQDLAGLAPEDVAETTLDSAAGFTYTVPLSEIPQKDGVAMLCLNLMVDFDVYAEGVTEYVPEVQE